MNLIEIQNLLEKRFSSKINKIEVIKDSGLNFVYKVYDVSGPYILKIYRKIIDFNNTNTMINYLRNNNINTINKVCNFKFNEFEFVIYSFIEGEHKIIYNDEQIDKIGNLLKIIYNNPLNNGGFTIIDKCNEYFNYLISINDKFVNHDIVRLLYNIYIKLKTNNNEFYLVHGDLSNVNLIWNDSLNVIDFDESILAPKEYELCSCIIKNCFCNDCFNMDQAKKIFYNIDRKIDIDYDRFQTSWDLYIIKVIIEKFYYSSLSNNKNLNVIQGNDHWTYWYKLLFQEKIISELFNYKKKKNLENQENYKTIHKGYNGEVNLITLNNEKIIKKTEFFSEINISINEYNLVNMLHNFGLNDLEMYNITCYDDRIVKYLSYCNGVNKQELDDKELMLITKKVFKMHHFLEEYCDYYSYDMNGNILEKMYWCSKILNSSRYSTIINNLISNERLIISLKEEKKVIVHDDLHRDNIIINNDNVTLLDFCGLKKYPKSYQLASLITNLLLLLYDDHRINIVKDSWPEKINNDKLNDLIMFRMLKGLAYYYEYLYKLHNPKYDENARILKKNVDFMLKYKMEDR